MTFSNNLESLGNQLGINPQLPSIKRGELFQERLEDVLEEHADRINGKTSGLFIKEEKLSSQFLFDALDPQKRRIVYRQVFDLVDLVGDIGASATVSYPHGIDVIKQTFQIYISCVTTSLKYFTSVYPDIYLDSTNIYFTNPIAEPLEKAIVIAEYTKD